MRDKLRAKARLKVSNCPEYVRIYRVARRRRSDSGMICDGARNRSRSIRDSIPAVLCRYRIRTIEKREEHKSKEQQKSHEDGRRQRQCPQMTGLEVSSPSRGTLFDLSCRAEQLGRAAQPAFELSKGRTIVGGRAVPNFFAGDSEIIGGRYVGLESDEKSFENSLRATSC
jgi:hypothetical protein